MSEKTKLIEQFNERGVTVLKEELTTAQLKEAFSLIEQGGTVKDLNELYEGAFEGEVKQAAPPPAAPAKGAEPAAPVMPPGAMMLTMEQMQEMMRGVAEGAAKAAIEAAMEPVNKLAAALQAEKKKPLYPTMTAVPKEHHNAGGLTIFCSGDHHTMDGFLIENRYVPCPRSILILFTATPAVNVQRFGDATQIQYICSYKTHDQREIDMFKGDIRWGSTYWDGGGQVVLDKQVELSMIASTKMVALNTLGFEALKKRCVDRGFPITNIKTMAAQIAVAEAREELERSRQMAARRLEDAEKSNMLVDPETATGASQRHRIPAQMPEPTE